MRKITCMLLALVLVLSLSVSVFGTQRSITTAATGYTSADQVEYITYSGAIQVTSSTSYTVENVTVNWGARGETATFLTTYAEGYYTGAYGWDTLSAISGGTGTSDAADSQLYAALRDMMKAMHTRETSYNETRAYYAFTDCVSNDYSQISSFYSGTVLTGTWDSGKTWNREHTWPNSKGLGGQDEHDIMMLRPTAKSENSARGNTAYGESSGYFDPGMDVRGDCARIMLYTYVRWGNTEKMWGSNGVMESMDVLLQWMEEDPVDTWELGRNDAVQSITGVRNVFVDYPEYAWLLFGQELPETMLTPSGKAGERVCAHENTELRNVKDATCVEAGYAGDTYCTDCGTQLDTGTEIPATGEHTLHETRKCIHCDYAETEITDCEHKFGAWETVIEPNNGRPGIQSRTCEKCGLKENQEVECLHVRTEVRDKKEAGCKDGYSGDAYCEDCGTLVLKGEAVPATGKHIYGPWITNGSKTSRYCQLCNLEEMESPKREPINVQNLIVDGLIVLVIAAGVVGAVIILRDEKKKKAEANANKK